MAETLYYLSGGKIQPDKLSVNEVRTLLGILHAPGTLLVLDGFERALRAFGGLDAAYQGDHPAQSPGEPHDSRFTHHVSASTDRDCISPLAQTSSSGRESAPSSAGESQSRLTSAATEKDLDADLRDLVARGLLHHDTKEGRFDLHPIVRRYAYDRLAAPDRATAHTRLRDYFAAVPKPDKAQRLTQEALVITERNGYVLQGADAHLELAKLALDLYSVGPSCGSAGTHGSASLPEMVSEAVKRASPAQRETARHHAEEARTLATCDGPPDYTYKAAYDEAGALLAQLG